MADFCLSERAEQERQRRGAGDPDETPTGREEGGAFTDGTFRQG